MQEKIQAETVTRDGDGYWTHPAMPDFYESVPACQSWLDGQGLEIRYAALMHEDDSHPAYDRYFEQGDPDISDWRPPEPSGSGWFVLSIHDTDDGPFFVWARHLQN